MDPGQRDGGQVGERGGPDPDRARGGEQVQLQPGPHPRPRQQGQAVRGEDVLPDAEREAESAGPLPDHHLFRGQVRHSLLSSFLHG